MAPVAVPVAATRSPIAPGASVSSVAAATTLDSGDQLPRSSLALMARYSDLLAPSPVTVAPSTVPAPAGGVTATGVAAAKVTSDRADGLQRRSYSTAVPTR